MADDMTKHAMHAVLEDMGRAARKGRAQRFMGPRKPTVDVTIGEVSELNPVPENNGMDPEELAELQSSLDVQR